VMADWLFNWSRQIDWRQKLRQLGRLTLGHFMPVVTLLKGLNDPMVDLSMGQTAEIISHEMGISRQQMDQWAMQSHHRLAQAQEKGWLGEEITPLFDPLGKLLERDDGLYPDSSMEKLSRLSPAFDRPAGRVTAGNSAQITDGAAWVLLADEEGMIRHGLTPIAKVYPAVWAGVDPARMGLGPVHAIARLLQRHGLVVPEVNLWEINEAFAGQVLACVTALADDNYCRRELALEFSPGKIPLQDLNAEGGAISIGHPVGASGARLILHLSQALQRTGHHMGVASLCIGGGQGGAMLLEAV
ncbi:MAG: acetyl-CoA C-acyltransferase, partial [Magnetococcales bacterium]|nr:acetyl-CoA C-acyltransferase [Magnetococcales bacterium]